MCGIVGFVGNNNVVLSTLGALEKLEYRGYDAAGIYVESTSGTHIYKSLDRIASLSKMIEEPNAFRAIAHTRWATHGKVTLENTHPHQSQSGRFVLVHNGIIQNYLELKQMYLSNYPFKGQTDSEVVVALLDYFASQGLSTMACIEALMDLLVGSFALVIVDQEDQNHLYFMKYQSPLVIVESTNGYYLTSDLLSVGNEAIACMRVPDDSYGYVGLNKACLYQHKEIQSLDLTPVEMRDDQTISKGPFPHFMLKEIHEQPQMFNTIYQTYQSLPVVNDVIKLLRDTNTVYIIGAGTSYHAGLVAKHLFEKHLGIQVNVLLASEIDDRFLGVPSHSLCFFISQSGETADLRVALKHLKRLSIKSVALTNVLSSTLASETDFCLPLLAGVEVSVASTKAFSAEVLVMALLVAFYLKTDRDLLDQSMHQLTTICTNQLDDASYLELAQTLATCDHVFYLGRQIDYALALEAALKLKEVSYIHAEGFAAGELKHGTIALIEPGTPVIGILTDDYVQKHVKANLEEVCSREAFVYRIEANLLPLQSLFGCLTVVLPLQLIAYHTANIKGEAIDMPRNLAKSVTVE